MNADNQNTVTVAQDLQYKSAEKTVKQELKEFRCKRCHKRHFDYEPHNIYRRIELICDKCGYKNIALI